MSERSNVVRTAWWDLLGGPAADMTVAMQEDFEQADDANCGGRACGTAPGAAGQARAGADASDKLPSAMRLEMVTMLPAILIIRPKN